SLGGQWMGPLGHLWARLLYASFGIGSHALTAAMVVIPIRLLAGKRVVRSWGEGVGLAAGLTSLSVLLHLAFGQHRIAGIGAGGRVGELLAEVLRAGVSTAGTALCASMGLLLALAATTGFRMAHVGRYVAWAARKAWAGAVWAALEVGRFWVEVFRAILPEREEPVEPQPRRRRRATPAPTDDTVRVGEPPREGDEPIVIEAELPPEAEVTVTTPVEAEPADEPAAQPVIVEPAFHKTAREDMKAREKEVADLRPDFRLPAVSLLKYDDTGVSIDKDAMLERAQRLVKTLGDYGVKGDVVAIRPGPVVTMYEFAPAAGARGSKIANLADDLAMALEAIRVRIVAPIPGKAAVGIEVPNKARETVFLKEIIADDVFQKAKSKLTLALGKDIEGRPVAVDLAKMPHLL